MAHVTNIDGAELAVELEHFVGTTRYYAHWTNSLKYTDGVRHLAERAGGYWLIDLIASYQVHLGRSSTTREFQNWVLTVRSSGSAVAICRDSSGIEVVRQEIAMTDFPMLSITLWLEGGVLILPSEH